MQAVPTIDRELSYIEQNWIELFCDWPLEWFGVDCFDPLDPDSLKFYGSPKRGSVVLRNLCREGWLVRHRSGNEAWRYAHPFALLIPGLHAKAPDHPIWLPTGAVRKWSYINGKVHEGWFHNDVESYWFGDPFTAHRWSLRPGIQMRSRVHAALRRAFHRDGWDWSVGQRRSLGRADSASGEQATK